MSGYHIRYFCDCGWSDAPWRGRRFFIEHDVCPDCGSEKESWQRKIGRYMTERTGERGFLGLPKTRTVFEEASS